MFNYIAVVLTIIMLNLIIVNIVSIIAIIGIFIDIIKSRRNN